MSSFSNSPYTSISNGNITANPLASIKYVEDTLNSMLVEQSDHIFSKFSEAYVTHRRVVVEWMIDVAEYFRLHITTSHAAVAYLDRLQPSEKCSRFEWQMMAICCLIISSKYNECEEHVPPLQKLEEIAQQVLTNECILYYELWALKKMGWKLNARTPVAFLDSYLFLSRHMPYDLIPEAIHQVLMSNECEAMLYSLATKCLTDHRFKPLPASAIATAILFHTLDNFPTPLLSKANSSSSSLSHCHWCPALTKVTGHDALTSRSVQQVLSLLYFVFEEEHAHMNKENNPLYYHNNTTNNRNSSIVTVGPEHDDSLGDVSISSSTTDDGINSALDQVVDKMNVVSLQDTIIQNNSNTFTSPDNNMKLFGMNNNSNNNMDQPKTDLSPVSIANFDQVAEC